MTAQVLVSGRSGRATAGGAVPHRLRGRARRAATGATADEVATIPSVAGHQYMPAAFAAGGVVQVAGMTPVRTNLRRQPDSSDAFITDTVVDQSRGGNRPSGTGSIAVIRRTSGRCSSRATLPGGGQGLPVCPGHVLTVYRDEQLERNYVNARISGKVGSLRRGLHRRHRSRLPPRTAPGPGFPTTAPSGVRTCPGGADLPGGVDRQPAHSQQRIPESRAGDGYTGPIQLLQGEPGTRPALRSAFQRPPMRPCPVPSACSARSSSRACCLGGRDSQQVGDNPARSRHRPAEPGGQGPNASNKDPNVTQQEVRQYQVELSLPSQPLNGDWRLSSSSRPGVDAAWTCRSPKARPPRARCSSRRGRGARRRSCW